MKSHKIALVVLRIFGVILLYHFFEEAVRLMNAVSGLGSRKGVAPEAFALHGLVNLISGLYLLLNTRKIVYGYLNDAFLTETENPVGETEAKYLFALSLKSFGLYFFYEFMQNLVTGYNIAASNWTPGDTTASAFVIQAIFHLLVSLWFIFKTKPIIDFVCRDTQGPLA